jgi:DNA-binding XRE family transcriptional regulator
MANIEKLWAIMAERGVSKNALAHGIGIDRSTLYRKADKGLDGFSCQEMRDIGLFLRLTLAEMEEIFLSGFSN